MGVALDDRAVILSLAPDYGAAKAGLQPGDAIVRVDDQPIKQRADVAAIVSHKAPGDKVRLTFVRDGKENTVEVALRESLTAQQRYSRAAERTG